MKRGADFHVDALLEPRLVKKGHRYLIGTLLVTPKPNSKRRASRGLIPDAVVLSTEFGIHCANRDSIYNGCFSRWDANKSCHWKLYLKIAYSDDCPSLSTAINVSILCAYASQSAYATPSVVDITNTTFCYLQKLSLAHR